MMKNRQINIIKLAKMCTSHLTTTTITLKDEYYIITIKNKDGFQKSTIKNKNDTSYKEMLKIILKIKKEIK